MIDHGSLIPYYIQVIEALKERINRGEWRVGDQLPAEQALCEMFGVSRTVIRQALDSLRQEGLVVRRKGRGTFVAEPKIGESLVARLIGFYQDMTERLQARNACTQTASCPRREQSWLAPWNHAGNAGHRDRTSPFGAW